MNLSVEKKWIIGGFSLAMLLTGFSGYVSYLNAAQLHKSTIKVEQVHRILTSMTDIMSIVLDVELQQRNYLLYGDKEELARYNTAIQTLILKIHQLRLKVANNSPQDQPEYQRLMTLESLMTQWRSLFAQIIHMYHKHSSATQVPDKLWQQYQQTRTKIQQLVAVLQTSEEQQMQQWIEQDQSNLALRLVIDLLSTFLSFIVLSSLFALHHRQLVKRQQAEIERQQAEVQKRILVQEKELSELKLCFFSMASHEFRTPLSLILGSAQLLMEDTQNWSLEKKHTNLERIQSAARIMNQLLSDMLTLTKAEVGQLEFAPALIDVESFCLNLIEDFRVLNEPNYQIEFISSRYCASAYLDEKLLYSILSNLLSNAIKYSPQGGTIQFRLSCTRQEIIFQVEDQGIGIPVDAQQNLYKPFYRANNVGTTVGTGLGLAVVKKCVDLHQGQVEVDSKVGVGTTVTVRLLLTFSR
ncbi:MAG: ATP-binding protein [Scytonema sp. PMC 1069.18]|nr:ATP-binding protein [Scytonema sp. PMC 1069.18]MEC4881144.1 ATP-binding protein [Scytonema sp. PMC 1070.18]